MNLLVFSDSHGARDLMKKVVERQLCLPRRERPEYILFLGDGVRDLSAVEEVACEIPILAVRGNCDTLLTRYTPDIRMPVFADRRVMMMHGHHFSVKSGLETAMAHAASKEADLLLFGHTHRPFCEQFEAGENASKPLTVFNPGSIDEGSFGVIHISPNGIFCSHGSV